MKNKIVLVLMQLKGISRKTILKSFSLSPNMECNETIIRAVLERARIEDGRLKEFSDVELKEAMKKADIIIENSLKQSINIVTYLDEEYPKRLKNISDSPTILYYKGNINCLNEKNVVAIIGTREPTEYGIKIARNLGSSFGRKNYVVVSGLALGCDMYGHIGCLDENGKTVAVMPCGLDMVYPAKNKQLAKEILEKDGCLISEYPVNTRVFKNYFIERDRLQSGLSDGVFVVETGEKGGTLHTIGFALEYKRILACFNHPAKYLTNPKTFGNQKLIREGKALSIGNDEELIEFRRQVEQNKEEPIEIKGVQTNLFDFFNEQKKDAGTYYGGYF